MAQRCFGPQYLPLFLFGGILLIFLAFFSGEGSYLDVREYLDDAQRLWLKGDLRVSENPPLYNRYAPGLPFVAGPFVYAGLLLSWATGGAVHARGITVLVVPVLGAAAAVLFFLWACSVGCGKRAACWAALLLAFTSPLLTYTQHFFAEVLVFCGVLLAVWSFTQALHTGRGGYWFTAGAALGLLPLSHFAAFPMTAALWAGMAAVLLADRAAARGRWKRVGLLTAAPLFAAAMLLYLNYSRYGHPFTTGYHAYYRGAGHTFFMPDSIPQNLKAVAAWLLRTPWLAPALVLTAWLYRRERKLLPPLALAVAAQLFFWLCFPDFSLFTNRYLLPLTALWALGLPLLGEWLEGRYPQRGLVYALLLFLMTGLFGFLRDGGIRPFHLSPLTGQVHCYTWYMQPPARAGQTTTPCGLWQWALLAVLLSGGSLLLARAWRLAGRGRGAEPEESAAAP